MSSTPLLLLQDIFMGIPSNKKSDQQKKNCFYTPKDELIIESDVDGWF